MMFIKNLKLYVLTILLTINLSISSEVQNDSLFKFPEKNFETPEDAINHFVERLAANDLQGAFEACAINETDLFDFKAFCKRLQAMVLLTSLAPSQSPILAQINRISQLNKISNNIKFMIYSLLSDEPLDGKTIMNPDNERITSFIKNIDSSKIKNLTVVKITLPISKEIFEGDIAKKNAISQARPYGADDSTERVVLYKLNNSYYSGGMHLLKYGKYWKIDGLYSSYANTSYLGSLEKITPDKMVE